MRGMGLSVHIQYSLSMQTTVTTQSAASMQFTFFHRLSSVIGLQYPPTVSTHSLVHIQPLSNLTQSIFFLIQHIFIRDMNKNE